MNLSIHIPQFEGPLALLLHLIRQREMDIFDIDIQLITSEYLEYIKKIKQFDLEVAGDFIAMASTLIQIKSKMLLPDFSDESNQEESQDPRESLVESLLEYQCFQKASKKLYNRSLLNRDVFKRCQNQKENLLKKEPSEIVIDENALFSLMTHYVNSIRKIKRTVHRIVRKTRSIASRILEIKDRFIINQRITLRQLVSCGRKKKEELLITFLSCLELSRMGFVSMYQSEEYGEIYLMGKRQIQDNVITQVEDYSGSHG